MTPSFNLTSQVFGYQFNPSGFPVTLTLDHTVIANDIWIDLNFAFGQKSQYLELRGCDLEGTHDIVEVKPELT